MTTLKSITAYHEAILQRFLEYRQDNPYFNFNLRKLDGKNERLRNGYWFQGNDTYISASPFILGSYINKTPAIYICVEDKKNKFIDSEKVATEFWVVRDETLKTTDENLFNFFGRLLDDGELFPQDVQHIDNQNHNRLTKTRIFPSFDAVLNFLFDAIPKIEKIAAECGVRKEDLYLNADEFNKRYSKIEDVKNGVYVKPEKDENTMLEKSEEELLEEYYNFLINRSVLIGPDKKDLEISSARQYTKCLSAEVAPMFIGEGNDQVKQLFNCSIPTINYFYNLCLNKRKMSEWPQATENRATSAALSKRIADDGSISRWNNDTANRTPSAVLNNLELFLEYHKGNLGTVTPEAREKTAVYTQPFSQSVIPLNQIFYGPPGTGKTYYTTELALDIIDGKEVNRRREDSEQKQRFAELQEEEQIEMVTFHQNFAYEDFIEGIKPVLNNDAGTVSYKLEDGLFKSIALKANDDRHNNFVLIIDEINRGNISKILGELITLIEPSKRLGNKDRLELALPYSKERFGVPKNLYIIGTMNTADRSLAQLDTALRRRFNFKEMMPDSSCITENPAGVGLKQLLEAMNKQIAEIDSREHQIGHAYFMEVDSLEALKECFQQKVIPLLQEYFFDDWGKIQSVLNKNGFVFERTVSKEEDNPIYDLLPYDDEAWDKPNSYIAIYQSQSLTDTTDE